MKSVKEIFESNMNLIISMLEQGLTDKEIAEKIGVGYSTFKKYKAEDVAFKGIIAECKDKQNQEVEQALYNNAIGFHYYEEVAQKVKREVESESGAVLTQEEVIVKKVKRFSKPDLNAQKFWLINQHNKKWKDDPNKVQNDKKLTKLKEKEVESKVAMMKWEE